MRVLVDLYLLESSSLLLSVVFRMPLDGLDEGGLPKNPDLQLMQWRFLLTVDDVLGVNKDETWDNLLQAVKENGESLTR